MNKQDMCFRAGSDEVKTILMNYSEYGRKIDEDKIIVDSTIN